MYPIQGEEQKQVPELGALTCVLFIVKAARWRAARVIIYDP